MTRRAPLGIALALAAVLAAGVIAVVNDDDQDPKAPTAALEQTALQEPVPVAAPTTAAPTPAPTASASLRPAPHPIPMKAVAPTPTVITRAAGAYARVAMPSCPTAPTGGGTPKSRVPIVAEAAVPAPVAAPLPAGDLSALRGRSVWITPFKASTGIGDIVARAKQARLTAIWVRTGGSKQGYYGDALLTQLVPAAHAAGIKVIAWDFPFLSDPLVDVERARRALAFRVDGQGIDAFSPDLETTAEGTFATEKRMASYLSRVRVLAGNRAVVSTVPRPTDKNVRSFPYAVQARWVDAYAPMIYWSCREPGDTAVQAVERLSRLGRPVHAVGQGYDMGSEGGRRGLPLAAETLRFLDASRRAGAIGGSLWTAERFGPGQWGPLGSYAWN